MRMDTLESVIKDKLFRNFYSYLHLHDNTKDDFGLHREFELDKLLADMDYYGEYYYKIYPERLKKGDQDQQEIKERRNYTMKGTKKERYGWEIFDFMAEYFIQKALITYGPLNNRYNVEQVDQDFFKSVLLMHMDPSEVSDIIQKWNNPIHCYYITDGSDLLFFVDDAMNPDFLFLCLRNKYDVNQEEYE